MIVAAAALVVVGLAVVVAARRGDDGDDPAEVLAAARAALDGGGVRFTARVERTRPEGPDGGGAPATSTSTEEGEWVGGVSHVTADRDPWTVETVVTPDGAYTRAGPGGTELPWQAVDALDMDVLELITGAGGNGDDATALLAAQELYLSAGDPDTPRARLFGAGGDLGDLTGVDPRDLLRAMERLGEAERDGVTVTATLRAPDEWVDAYGAPLPDASAELDLGDDDRPVAFRLHIASGDAAVDIAVDFEAWGEPLDIAVPEVRAPA